MAQRMDVFTNRKIEWMSTSTSSDGEMKDLHHQWLKLNENWKTPVAPPEQSIGKTNKMKIEKFLLLRRSNLLVETNKINIAPEGQPIYNNKHYINQTNNNATTSMD